MRAPFNVAVVAYKMQATEIKFLILKRADESYWQVIAGGGEDNESPTQAAEREALEETSLAGKLFQLKTQIQVSVGHFKNHNWPDELKEIPQFYFALEAINNKVKLSSEHLEYQWATFDEAVALLKWESDRQALLETYQRIL